MIDHEKVSLMTEVDSLRRGWQACEAENVALAAQNLQLRKALEIGIKSAHPHPTEHPTMTAAWAVMRAALALDLPDAGKMVEGWREKAGLLDWIAENIDSLQVVRRRKPNHDTWTVSYPFPATGCITDIDGTELLVALRAAKAGGK